MSFVLRSSICVFHRFNHLLTPAKLCKFNAESTASHYQILMINQRSFKRYQRFGHQKGVGDLGLTRMEKIIMIYCCVGFSIVVFDYGSIYKTYFPKSFQNFVTRNLITPLEEFHEKIRKKPGPKVDALTFDTHNQISKESNSNESNGDNKEIKSKSGFRDKRIIEYENRIRSYSTPDKIFRYFASIKLVYGLNETEIFMTPDDFLRAITPGIKQPDGLGLDQFKKVDMSKENASEFSSNLNEAVLSLKKDSFYGLKSDSIFYKLSNFGLINFSDFLFLLTVISVSKRHFEIAFRMFDLNGDGNVEYEEFEKVHNAILKQTSIGKKMGTKVGYKGVSSALAKYFFGEDLKQKLTIERFLDFQNQLQTEILTLEFKRKNPNPITGRIKESEFADLLITYAKFSKKKRDKMIKRIKKKFTNGNSQGLSLEDYLKLFHLLQNINDVDTALTVFHIAGASIDQATLKHVAKTVAHVDLSDHLVNVLFILFDENEDGQLSNREFIAVMKERLRRGLTKPKDTGFMKLLHALWNSLKFDL